MSETPVIDLDTIETLKSLNPDDNGEFLKEIIAIFLEDTPQRIAELESSLGKGDLPTFIRAAHSIKGSSSNMGAMVLRETAEALESKAKASGLASVGELLIRIKADFAQAECEIKKQL